MRNCPPQIATIADENGLGEVLARYRLSVLIESSFLVPLGALGFFGLLMGDDVGRGIGAVAAGLTVLLVVPTWRKVRHHLYLCANGIITTTAPTRVKQHFTWGDVAHIRVWATRIYQPDAIHTLPRCVLALNDGTTVKLTAPPYVRAEELTSAVEQLVSEVRYPRRLAEIGEAGGSTFGPITVTPLGLRDGDRFVGWSEITRVELARVRFRVWSGTGRPVISRQVRTIPDVSVFAKIVSSFVRDAG